jgi:hypothetical protein
LDDSNLKKIKIIDSFWTFFVALAILGPFALPLLWRNPRLSPHVKGLGSVFIVLFTLVLIWFSKTFLSQGMDQYQELKSMQESRD